MVSTDRSSGLIPEGTHRFVVKEFELREGPKGEYWNFTCEAASNSPFAGQMIWVVVSLTPQSRFKLDEWLDAFNVPEGLDIDGDYFIGEYFRGVVSHKEDSNGKQKANCDAFLPDAKSKKVVASAAPTKKSKKVVEPEDDEDDEEEELEEDDDEELEDEEDEEDDEEEEEPIKKKQPAKKTSKPLVKVANSSPTKGKLPPGKKRYTKPF